MRSPPTARTALIGPTAPAAVWPHASRQHPSLSPRLPPCASRCERNPPHTAIHPAKWRALETPDGSQLELAPHGTLSTYLKGLHTAPDTQAHLAAHTYVAPGAEAAAEDGGHSDND